MYYRGEWCFVFVAVRVQDLGDELREADAMGGWHLEHAPRINSNCSSSHGAGSILRQKPWDACHCLRWWHARVRRCRAVRARPTSRKQSSKLDKLRPP